MRAACLALLLAGCATLPVFAEDGPPIAEADVLTLRVLTLERELLAERALRIGAEAKLEFRARGEALDRAVEALAVKAKVKLGDGWRPDLEAKVWKKGAP